MATLYRIKDWARSFENNETRKLKHLAWTPVTTKLAGRSYAIITAHPRACEILAAFEAMRKVAANAPRRGYLEDHDGPLDATDLSIITRLPVGAFEIALEVLTAGKTAWLEAVSPENVPAAGEISGDSPEEMSPIGGAPGESPEMPGESPDEVGEAAGTSRLQDITGQDRTVKQTPTTRAKAAGIDLPADPAEQVRVILGAVMVGHVFGWGNGHNEGGAVATVVEMVRAGGVDATVEELFALYKQGPPNKKFKAATLISELLYWRDKRADGVTSGQGHKPETFDRSKYATGRIR